MASLFSRRPVALLAASLLLLVGARHGTAQESKPAVAEPVYLDEPADPPEPTIAKEGPVTENYDDGKVRVERNIRLLSDNQIVNHGKFTEYYKNGQKFSEGDFDNGVPNGAWSYWHDNGQLAKTVNFAKGAPDGAWEVFRADGTLQSKKGYKAGKREGDWVIYYEDGKTPKIEQKYVNGELSGQRNTFFPSGKKRQEANFADGKLEGQMTEWDESGRKVAEATFSKGMLNGKLSRYGADGSVSEQVYRDNKPVAPGAN